MGSEGWFHYWWEAISHPVLQQLLLLGPHYDANSSPRFLESDETFLPACLSTLPVASVAPAQTWGCYWQWMMNHAVSSHQVSDCTFCRTLPFFSLTMLRSLIHVWLQCTVVLLQTQADNYHSVQFKYCRVSPLAPGFIATSLPLTSARASHQSHRMSLSLYQWVNLFDDTLMILLWLRFQIIHCRYSLV